MYVSTAESPAYKLPVFLLQLRNLLSVKMAVFRKDVPLLFYWLTALKRGAADITVWLYTEKKDWKTR